MPPGLPNEHQDQVFRTWVRVANNDSDGNLIDSLIVYTYIYKGHKIIVSKLVLLW